MRIQDVMSKKVISIAPQSDVAAARIRLEVDEIDHLVVMDGKRVVGVVSDRDIARAKDDLPVARVMSHPVVTIAPEATLRRAAGMMRGRAIGCLPVLAEDQLVGIVTTSDLLTALSKGEIHAAPPPERVSLRRGVQRKRSTPV